MGYKHYNTNGRNEWTARRTLLKNKLNLVAFHESILVSLWTFQPTLIVSNDSINTLSTISSVSEHKHFLFSLSYHLFIRSHCLLLVILFHFLSDLCLRHFIFGFFFIFFFFLLFSWKHFLLIFCLFFDSTFLSFCQQFSCRFWLL